MRSKEYWEGRFVELQRSQLKRADTFAHELEDLHARMQKEIEDDITVWHKKVATANGISMADAKKLMSRKDRKEFQWTLEEYQQHAKADLLSGVTSANVLNASANWHLSYLDGMKLQLEHHVDKLYKNIDSKTRNHFKESLNDNYLNTAFELQKGIGIGEKMEVPYDERKLENILRTPWANDGKNFSQRIWKDRTQLVNNLQKNLSESVIRGDSDTDMIQALSKDEKKAEFNTRRLVETESAYFDSLSEQECCEDFGVEKYRFLAVLDMKTSDICQELDNKVFLEKERQVGVNAPPMHPFCRSTTAPVIDEEFLTSRRAKNPKTGEYDEIPPEMNYKQWKEKYVEGKEPVKQEQVKTESTKGTSTGTGSSGAEIKIESPKIESEYKETPIPSREEKFDSKAYEDRVQKRANKQAVEPVTIETERPVNYGNTEKIYSETEISKEVQEKRIVLKKKADNFIENLEKKIDSKEITKELADETQNLIKELEKQTDDILKEIEFNLGNNNLKEKYAGIIDDTCEINKQFIKSTSYKNNCSKIDSNKTLCNNIYKLATSIFEVRSELYYTKEEMYIFNKKGRKRGTIDLNNLLPHEAKFTEDQKRYISLYRKNGLPYYVLHTHPTSSPPSLDDFNHIRNNGYFFGIILCHNGDIYKYYPTQLKRNLGDSDWEKILADIKIEERKTGKFVESCRKVYAKYGLNFDYIPAK